MTIDEFLESLPQVERNLTVEVGPLSFVFEAPEGYEDIVQAFQAGAEWAAVCQKTFPMGSPFLDVMCDAELAREIGVMVRCMKSPEGWQHLEMMTLAKKNGLAFARIRNAFDAWLKGYFAHDFAGQIASEKKD